MARCSTCGAKKATPDADCPECSTARHDLVQLPLGVSVYDKTPKDPEAASRNLRKDPLIGKTVGNYRIESLLGAGGMGTVYRAFHPGLDRAAAVKVLRPELSEDAGIVERFFREAKATNQIKHPGIVDIFDLGSMPNGRCYMVMELLEGESLEQYIATHGAIVENVVTAFGRKILDILAVAHQKKIIHRDLKPANIFLAKGPNHKTTVKLLDFGLAKILASRSGPGSTADGMILGTPHYMPPEQARSPSSIDGRADIYSLGVILYEMATGRPIFTANTPLEMMHKHQVEAPVPPRTIRPQLSKGFEAAILRALSKDSSQRFSDCESFSRALNTNPADDSLDDQGDDISTLLDVDESLRSEISFAPEGGNTLDLIQQVVPDAKPDSQSAIAIPMATPHPALVATQPSPPGQPSSVFRTEPDPTPSPYKFNQANPSGDAIAARFVPEPTAPIIRVKPRSRRGLFGPIVLLLVLIVGSYAALQYVGALFAPKPRLPIVSEPASPPIRAR